MRTACHASPETPPAPARKTSWEELKEMGCEVAQRLVALLQILERGPAPYGVLGDEAILDAWFGIRAPVLPCVKADVLPCHCSGDRAVKEHQIQVEIGGS